ncbi:uncharacterized protein LOC132268358 [Cornus florida]|uniref:uncharacterized protein LOC132268358 n=1 Tax=Cornus florida TaxID=4283 RepID=UPI002898011C|nr:uncharacterized protein LOC132268358 [Cornus florida]
MLFLNVEVYPKVKVKEEDEDDPFNLHDGANSLPESKIFESPPCTLGSHVEEDNQNQSPPSVAKIPETSVPKSKMTFKPPSKGPGKISKHTKVVQEDIKPKVRDSSVLRPRAVLSSPDNDEMIGNKNKLISRRVSALKRTTLDRFSPAGARVKPRPLKVGSPLNMKTGSMEVFEDKSGRTDQNQISTLNLAVSREKGCLKKEKSSSNEV